jgi:hypothetical protein
MRSNSLKFINIILIFSSAAGCTGPSRAPRVPTNTSEAADASGYYCDLLAKSDVNSVIGSPAGLRELTNNAGDWFGGCTLQDHSVRDVLGLAWQNRNGTKTVSKKSAEYKNFRPVSLPLELGNGFFIDNPVPYDDFRPFYAISEFGCGRANPWIRIDLLEVAAGRDYGRDLTELIRAAERRFGALHGCTPGELATKDGR